MKILDHTLLIFTMVVPALMINPGGAWAKDVVESSYHGQLGKSPALGGWGNGLGMLEKWDAFSNFSFEKQGRMKGFTEQCGACHTSSYRDPATGKTDCKLCHETKDGTGSPTLEQCLKCHGSYGTLKRGDVMDEEKDAHVAMGMGCHNCHERLSDPSSDHQFAKGYAIDTTEDTVEGTLSCVKCHDAKPHGGVDQGEILDTRHVTKIACITCHTGPRPADAIKNRTWNKFTKDGKPVTETRKAGWMPDHKWYTGKKLGVFPVLGATELMAKIHPFNVVTYTWFVEAGESGLDDIIPVPEVKAADANGDGETTVQEMKAYGKGKYKNAVLLTREFNYSISHSVVPRDQSIKCNDCHGEKASVLNWEELGYARDPYEKK